MGAYTRETNRLVLVSSGDSEVPLGTESLIRLYEPFTKNMLGGLTGEDGKSIGYMHPVGRALSCGREAAVLPCLQHPDETERTAP